MIKLLINPSKTRICIAFTYTIDKLIQAVLLVNMDQNDQIFIHMCLIRVI